MIAKSDRHRQLGLREVTARRHHRSPQRPARHAHLDERTNRVSIRPRALERQAQPVVPSLQVVAEEARRAFHGGQHQIQISVAVDVGEGRAAGDHRAEQVAGGIGRDRHEAAAGAARVPEETCRLRVLLAGLHFVDLVFDVAVGRQQIEPAIEIVVEEQHAKRQRAARRRADAGHDRLVRKLERRLLGHVQRRHLVGEVADRDAERSVVAEVGRVDSHRAAAVAVGIERDAGGGADFREGPVALVVKHEVLHGIVGDDEVGPAVGVQIDGGDAERFRQRHLRVRVSNLHAGLC